MRDCYNLVEALSKVRAGRAKLADEIAAFNSEVVERGAAEVVASTKACFALHDFQNGPASGKLDLRPIKPAGLPAS